MKEIIQTNNKRAVLYCRVSTKEQVDEGNSLGTQERICKDYAIKNEYSVAEVFIEQGESAKTADRTELQKLFAYCADKRNNIKAVIIYKLDRLSRNTDDYSQIRLLLKRYGVEIKSTSEHFEDSPVGRFMENTMANIAQFDNDIRAERCSGGMKEAMREGRYVWMAPVGYDNVKVGGRATIAQNPTMAPLIQKTFELIASNIYPTEEVRRIISKEGLCNKQGKPLTKGYFYNLLKNEVYAGLIVKFGEKHKGLFNPIISEELFSQVQRVLKHKGRKHSAYVTDHPDFPLRKFVVNNDNNKKLTGSWSSGRNKRFPYYRFGGKDSNYNKYKFEDNFMLFMDKYGIDEKNFEELKVLVNKHLVKATEGQRKEEGLLKKKSEELKNKQTSIIKKNIDGFISDSVMKEQLEIIEKELFQINTALTNIPNTRNDFDKMLNFLEVYLKKPSEIWKKAKIDKQIKLQWFQFPQGLTFKDDIFGTEEVASVFKAKDLVSSTKSSWVDPTGLEPATSSLQMRRSSQMS